MRQKGLVFLPVAVITALIVMAAYFIYKNIQIEKQISPIEPIPSAIILTPVGTTKPTIKSRSTTLNTLLKILNNEVKPNEWVLVNASDNVLTFLFSAPNDKYDINKYGLGELFTGNYEPLITNGWITDNAKSGDGPWGNCWGYIRKNTIKPSIQFCTSDNTIELTYEE